MERADQYHELAQRCLARADRTNSTRERDSLLQSAAGWKTMATQWEKTRARIEELRQRTRLDFPFADPSVVSVPDAPETCNVKSQETSGLTNRSGKVRYRGW